MSTQIRARLEQHARGDDGNGTVVGVLLATGEHCLKLVTAADPDAIDAIISLRLPKLEIYQRAWVDGVEGPPLHAHKLQMLIAMAIVECAVASGFANTSTKAVMDPLCWFIAPPPTLVEFFNAPVFSAKMVAAIQSTQHGDGGGGFTGGCVYRALLSWCTLQSTNIGLGATTFLTYQVMVRCFGGDCPLAWKHAYGHTSPLEDEVLTPLIEAARAKLRDPTHLGSVWDRLQDGLQTLDLETHRACSMQDLGMGAATDSIFDGAPNWELPPPGPLRSLAYIEKRTFQARDRLGLNTGITESYTEGGITVAVQGGDNIVWVVGRTGFVAHSPIATTPLPHRLLSARDSLALSALLTQVGVVPAASHRSLNLATLSYFWGWSQAELADALTATATTRDADAFDEDFASYHDDDDDDDDDDRDDHPDDDPNDDPSTNHSASPFRRCRTMTPHRKRPTLPGTVVVANRRDRASRPHGAEASPDA